MIALGLPSAQGLSTCQKPLQYCKVISLHLIKINGKKITKNICNNYYICLRCSQNGSYLEYYYWWWHQKYDLKVYGLKAHLLATMSYSFFPIPWDTETCTALWFLLLCSLSLCSFHTGLPCVPNHVSSVSMQTMLILAW